MKLTKSTSTQVGIWVIVITVLMVVTLGEVVGRLAQNQLQKDQGYLLDTLANTMVSRLQQHMLNQANDVSFFASLPQIKDVSVSLEEKQSLMKRMVETYPQFTFLGITDSQGTILTDVYGLLEGKNVAKRDWFLGGKEKLTFVDVHDAFLLAKHLPAPEFGDGLLRLVDIAVPITSQSGEFLGVLGAHLSLDWAYKEKNRLLDKLSDTGVELLIYNTRGELLLSSQQWEKSSIPDYKIFNFNLGAKSTLMHWPNGEDYFAATARILHSDAVSPLGWYVVVYKPASLALASARNIHDNILLFGLSFATALAIILSLVLRSKLAPLKCIGESADKLRDGQLDTSIPLINGNNEIALLSQSLVRLVTQLQSQNKQLRLKDRVFRQASQAIVILDVDGKIENINPACEGITGYVFKQLEGKSISILCDESSGTDCHSRQLNAVIEQGSWRGEVWYRKALGQTYPVMLSLTRLDDDSGKMSHIVAMFDDISEQVWHQERLLQLANFDTLTGYSNRYSLEKQLNERIKQAERADDAIAILFIDLDDFKHINDIAGHATGDKVLKQVCQRFDSLLAEDELLSRWGGDEFVIVLPGESWEVATELAKKLLSVLALPFYVGSSSYFISASIGIATYPESSKFVGGLLRCADAAMYKAKKDGKNRLQIYYQGLDQALSDFIQVQNRLRIALSTRDSGLYTVYQPQFSMDGEQIVGAEVLLRWTDSELGVVSPAHFIPIAEQTQLISFVGNFVIERTLADFHHLMSISTAPFTLSINVSILQFVEVDFIEHLERLVSQYNIPRHRLCLEITETALMTDIGVVLEQFKHIKSLGYLISIDDFGTGYSSLQYLSMFKPHEIKVDRSFVQSVTTDEYSRNILLFTKSLADGLNLSPIAEGVETAEQLAALKEIGNFNIQGFLYAKPMTYEDFCSFLEQKEAILN